METAFHSTKTRVSCVNLFFYIMKANENPKLSV